MYKRFQKEATKNNKRTEDKNSDKNSAWSGPCNTNWRKNVKCVHKLQATHYCLENTKNI